MKEKKFIYCFIFVMLLGFVLRFYELGKIPPNLNTDETALGYNAYSILKTGMDEYGKKFPLALRSFDDYKPPFYSYSIIPAMVLFGKNEFAVRFPSALAGSLTVILIFAVMQELTKKKWLSLITAFLLAISPWHIQYSRTAFEVNEAIFFMIFGIWTFLKAREKGYYLLISGVSFALTLYTYQAARLVCPLFVLSLIIFFWRDFLQKKKWMLLSALIGLIMTVPLIGIATGIQGQLRPLSISIFTETQPLETFRERIQRDYILNTPFISFWHNRRFIYMTPFVSNYLVQFRPEFLFSADPNHHAPDIGLLYLWQIPFIFLGFHYLLSKEKPKFALLVILWLIISPLGAALAKESPAANRSEFLVIPLQIILGFGLFYFLEKLKTLPKFYPRLFISITVFLIAISFVYYLHMYFVHLPYELPFKWEYGKGEAATEVAKIEKNYKRIIVSTNLDEAYIYFLFYSNYDPQKYISEGGTSSGSFNEMKNKMGKYEFHVFDPCQNPKQFVDTLFVWGVKEYHPYIKVIKQINLPNGTPDINIGIFDPPNGDLKEIKCS